MAPSPVLFPLQWKNCINSLKHDEIAMKGKQSKLGDRKEPIWKWIYVCLSGFLKPLSEGQQWDYSFYDSMVIKGMERKGENRETDVAEK